MFRQGTKRHLDIHKAGRLSYILKETPYGVLDQRVFELGAGLGNEFSMAEFMVNRAIILRKPAEFFNSHELTSSGRHRANYGANSHRNPVNSQ
jgi:hypothetical protein